ncbi:enhanced serine sensitivity protein SseB [Streptomyces spongiicola]|uniref:Enhanced serine sensitivity protein SseB n=1 Tax=Streptomyces spongiicola TaxID=1690221 RepID=A0ABN5KL44_9ACTN|nr:enhanced serine sensitivity protein SseB [Streptomyces spongiicola]AWK10874.1 enhanced serine sensitivity protein SseB [Streptomyces spongiicola]
MDTTWPANELEEVLAASVGNTSAGARLVEVLARSPVWVPLPNGGGPDSAGLDLPTVEIDGIPYVPVFSSREQFRLCAGDQMSGTVAPAVEFARGLPPQLGIAVNPGGTVGVPLPPPAVAELCRTDSSPLGGSSAPGGPRQGAASGGRVRLFEPDWQEEPVDFLAAAAGEFESTRVVQTARRILASIEGDPPVLFVGVQLSAFDDSDRAAPMDALGRALGRVAVKWPVNLVLLDIAQDPVGDWMLTRVRPFYTRQYA